MLSIAGVTPLLVPPNRDSTLSDNPQLLSLTLTVEPLNVFWRTAPNRKVKIVVGFMIQSCATPTV